MYGNLIITLILIVDSLAVYLLWQAEQRKSKTRMTRKFNKILQSIGLR
jgi:hypothetical protein